MLAHGFSTKMLGRLVIDGLAIAQPGTMFSGQRQVAVRWMTITDLGQFVISDGRRSLAGPQR